MTANLISASSFLRFVGLPFDELAHAFDDWWESEQCAGFVPIGDDARLGRLATGPAAARAPLVVRHRRTPLGPPLPMELELSPWSRSPALTRMEVVARRPVHLSARYFEVGHRVLDAVTAQLAGRAAAGGPGTCGDERFESIGFQVA